MMKSYPSISGPKNAPQMNCHLFVKYDGSNIRAEWSKKRGWYKFGTRNHMLNESHPILGKSIDLFKSKYGSDLEQIFKTEKKFKGIENFIVFFEFFGTKSFAGQHFDDDKYDVVLFDVNPLRKNFLPAKQFIDIFGHLKIAENISIVNFGPQLIDDVRNEKFSVESSFDIKTRIPEGVICKGLQKNNNIWMCKIKTNRYLEELKRMYSNWELYWED